MGDLQQELEKLHIKAVPVVSQLWECEGCKTTRVWGRGQPEHPQAVAQLLCEGGCSRRTGEFGISHQTGNRVERLSPHVPHRFVGLS
jgi:hypothetical protein